MIVGLTGTMASGKGEVVNILKEKGYEYYVFSDILKEEAKKRGIKPTRENLQKLGNELKEKYKKGILAKKLIAKFKTDKVIVDGVRSSEEIRTLREHGNFILIGIDAPQKLRFERIKKRARLGDPKTFKEFKRLDDRENLSINKAQEINKCMKMADFVIENDGSLQHLKKKIKEILNIINN